MNAYVNERRLDTRAASATFHRDGYRGFVVMWRTLLVLLLVTILPASADAWRRPLEEEPFANTVAGYLRAALKAARASDEQVLPAPETTSRP